MRLRLVAPVVALLAAGIAGLPHPAHASPGRSLLGLDVELGGVRNVDGFNSDLFTFGVVGQLGLEFNMHPLLGVHVAGAAMFLPGDQSPDSTAWLGGRAGLRLHWGVAAGARSNDGWIDAHYNIGQSGNISRSGFDLGVGWLFSLTRGLRLGPFVRYQWGSDPRGQDPQWIMFGLSIGILGDPRTDLPDADRDGVLDLDDQCPTEPSGAHPDERRRGCPAHDQDGDGVADQDDQCPGLASGAQPDPRRSGCPLGDADADGVPDPQDACPTVPRGAHPDRARPGCPGSDPDGDGVYDPDDRCPNTHQSYRGDPARPGCPMPDRDSDSVPDSEDRCPSVAGAPSRDPTRNGCPGLVRVEQGQIRILRPVFFASNRDSILDESFPVLAAVTDAMAALGIRRLRIEGHSDNRGHPGRNLDLSQRRANSIKRWMIDHGIDAAALVAVGYGQDRPVESNSTAMGRASNRRVEFHILDVQ